MILNLCRCLLVSRNNLLWFFKTFCKQVRWVFAKPIVSKLWERKQLAGIASFDCIALWILYVHIVVQMFGNHWNQVQMYNQNPQQNMSALEFSYKFYMKLVCSYMQFICSFKTTCTLYAVLTKLHVVLETAYILHIKNLLDMQDLLGRQLTEPKILWKKYAWEPLLLKFQIIFKTW